MEWLKKLDLSEEQAKAIQEQVEKIETNHNAKIDEMESDHKLQLQNTREATQKRVSKQMVSREDYEAVKEKASKYENLEIDTLLEKSLKDLPIKEGFLQDIKEKVSANIDYSQLKEQTPKAKAELFTKETKAFLDNEENARFKEVGAPGLKINKEPKADPNASKEAKIEQAKQNYSNAFKP